MPRRELLTPAQREQLLAFREDAGELIRVYTLSEADDTPSSRSTAVSTTAWESRCRSPTWGDLGFVAPLSGFRAAASAGKWLSCIEFFAPTVSNSTERTITPSCRSAPAARSGAC
jgi:hypothetical protein